VDDNKTTRSATHGDGSAPDSNTKRTALLGLAAALVITVGAWFFIDRATDRGLERLQLIDRVWAECDTAYHGARNAADTSHIDTRALSAVIDNGNEGAPRRCGDMRKPVDTQAARDSMNREKATRDLMPTRQRR
jgi:hypothetical protein